MPLVRRQISPHASALRRNMTDVEWKLWFALRNRRLDGHKFRRQPTIGPYVVDFLCIEARLIVELDGGQHNPEVDRGRAAYPRARGYEVLRFWNNEVIDSLEGILSTIFTFAAARMQKKADPHPTLSRMRERA